MKAMAQKRITEFFNTKPKKQAKIIKYCISKIMNETKDKQNEVICLSGPKELEKQVKKTVGRQKREINKGHYGSTVHLPRFT